MGLTDMKSGGKVRVIGYAWISVDERLPEEDGVYLVACSELGKRYVHVKSYDADLNMWDRWAKYDKWDLRITHWMPLPLPPDNTI